MKKLLLPLLVVILLMGISAPVLAQDATTEPAEVEPWVCPEGFEGQTLSVYNWSTYIAEDTIPNFEEACGVTVNYDIYDSNEAMLARLRQGNPGYDIIVPSDYMVAIMIQEGLLMELDHSKLPNMINIDETLTAPPFDPENTYSIPYQWGTVGIGYNTENVDEEITSWQQLFEYEGNVAWLDDLRSMLGVALVILGYDPNTSNPDEIAEARDYLMERGENVVVVAADDGQAWLERGDVDMTVEYSGDIIDLIYECECDTYAYVIPEEGSVIWVDNLSIPTGAPNPELAHVFIDYILNPQVAADISNFTAYGSPNGTAIDLGLIDEELLSDPAVYPGPELTGRLFWVQESPDAEEAYNDAWDEILIFVGQ